MGSGITQWCKMTSGNASTPQESESQDKGKTSEKKDLAKELGETEKSYRNSYIIAGIFIVFMVGMVVFSLYPRNQPVDDKDDYPLAKDSNVLPDISLKSKLPFDTPVEITITIEPNNENAPPINASIYFLRLEDAEEYQHKTDKLKEISIDWKSNANEMTVKTSLDSSTSYAFVVIPKDSTIVNVRYNMDAYPYRPLLPYFLAFGIIGCIVPFVYILVHRRKSKNIRKALGKEKRKRRRKEERKAARDQRRRMQQQPRFLYQQGSQYQQTVQQQPIAMGIPAQLSAIIQQLQVIRQQEGAVSNQLKFEGSPQQKQLLLRRYQEIQLHKESLQKEAQRLQGEIQMNRLQGMGRGSNPAAPQPQTPYGAPHQHAGFNQGPDRPGTAYPQNPPPPMNPAPYPQGSGQQQHDLDGIFTLDNR